MKNFGILVVCCVLAGSLHGQEMTLQECILTAIESNLSLVNARIDVEKGVTGVSQNRARLLPVINGMIQVTDYLKRPVNVTTGVLLGNDFPDDPTWQTIRSMQYNAGVGVQFSMPLYDKTIFAAIDVARTIEKINGLSYEKAVEDLTVQIGKVYYLAQASQELERLTSENMARMEELCNITEALFMEGVVMEVDLNRVRINLQALVAQRDQSRTLHGQQLNMLRFLMDMSPEVPLRVTRMCESVESWEMSGISGSLPELLILAQQKRLAEQRVKVIKSGYMPTLSLTGYAGALGYQERFDHFFRTGASTDNWFGNCYIGLSVKIPLFDANSKKLQIRQYQYDSQQASNRMELMRKQLDENYADAVMQLSHNMEVFRTQLQSRMQAEEVYNVTEEQYKEGIASMTALLQDEMQLRAAQSACVQALCQCRLAQLDLLRLSGNLSQLQNNN